jgi:cytochrome c oxidase assembly protein subunit 15
MIPGAATEPGAGSGRDGAGPATGADARRRLALWLAVCAGFVCAVLIVGGITRLTRSGLSIVEWQPLVGAVPPLSAQEWSTLFDQYRATPEFRLVNPDMTLEGFQRIFWWEYAHRLLARAAGLVFLLPFLGFLRARAVSGPLAWRLGAIFALGAAQGALGWFMVRSGLVDDPRVSPLRLAAHLGLALLLIGAMLWTSWGLRTAAAPRRPLSRLAAAAVAAVFAMALTGAMVAGTRAGFGFNTFPLMDGSIAPPGMLQLSPWYLNFLYNLATVQFVHRASAVVVIALTLALWASVRRAEAPAGRVRAASAAMLAALALQVTLGIATLLSVVALPLAAAHQAGAVLLYASTLWTAFTLTRAAARSGQAPSIASATAAPISSAR